MNPKCFIIAEAGVNHNGDIDLAKRLIEAAHRAGADAVKFQTWITELLVTENSASAAYQEQNTGITSQFKLLKDLELPHSAFVALKEHAAQVGIEFLSTPDEETSAAFLAHLGVRLIKVGSGELTNLSFLDHLARYGLPMIISTGMATLDEVRNAVNTIKAAGNSDITILHCVSSYPAHPAECNLRAMDTLSETFGLPVGFSDHTDGYEMCIAAVARGARVIEKHLTLDRTMSGPDHSCSLEPQEFGEMVRMIRNVEVGLGDGIKRPTASELTTKAVVRKEILAASDLPAGTKLGLPHLVLRRSGGTGLGADSLPVVLGKTTTRAISANSPISFGDLA